MVPIRVSISVLPSSTAASLSLSVAASSVRGTSMMFGSSLTGVGVGVGDGVGEMLVSWLVGILGSLNKP